jgi:hypothetical protein
MVFSRQIMTPGTPNNRSKLSQAIPGLKRKISLLSFVSLLGVAGFLLSVAPTANAACSPPATTYGTDTLTATAPTATTYNLWVRMQVPSTNASSLMLQVDGGTCYNVGGGSAITPSTWTWVNYQNGSAAQVMQASLTAGNHSLELIGISPGVEVDSVLLLANASCIPTGTGSNCTTGQPAPTAPTLTASAASSTTVALKWTQSTDSSGLSVAGYYVFRGSTKIATITSPTTLSYTDTVAAGSTNSYTVEAYDNSSPVVTSSASNAVSVATGLSAPSGLSATAISTSQINLSWKASTDGGGPGVAGYDILRNGTNIASLSSSMTSYSDKSVVANTAYSYTVEAFDSSTPPNVSAPSTAASVTTAKPIAPPQTPTNVKATAPTDTSVALSWTASTDTGGPGVAGYYIIRGGTTIGQVTSPATTYSDKTAVAKTTYSYTVEAFDSSTPPNVSTPSTATTVTTPSAPVTTPATTPTNLVATPISSSQINLSWNASTASGGVTGYTVYRDGTAIATVTTTTYGSTGLSANTSYSYDVVALSAAGNSKASTTVSATTKAVTTATTATVEGIVSDAKTQAPLSGVNVHTGTHGTLSGAATADTNSAGQYVLSNITTTGRHSYTYARRGYTTLTFQKAFPVGINTVNESLTSTTHKHHHRG